MGELKLSFNVDELNARLQENRVRHEETHSKAVEGYREAVGAELRDKLHNVGKGKKINPHLTNVYPEHHLDDYDDVIAMLELTSDSQIELTQVQFRQYVRDEWGWKQQFTASTSSYIS